MFVGILRFLLLAALFVVVRRVITGLLSKKNPDARVGAKRPRRQKQTKARRDRDPDDIGAGQRIEEAEFEELD